MYDYILQTSKKKYAIEEPIEFSLQNNSNKNVFDLLSFLGNILQKQTGFFGLGKEFKQIITFDQFGAVTDKASRTLPEPHEVNAGKSINGKWTGIAYKKTGPDKF